MTAHHTFIGRENELSWFRKFLSGSKGDKPRMLLISGERGIGKTYLLGKLRLEIEDEGYVYLQGRCYNTTKDPYLPLREAFDMHRETMDMPEETVFISPHILPKSGSSRSECEDTKIFDEADKTVFYETMNGVKKIVEKKSMFLSIDDLQWADELTLNMLHYLSLKLEDDDIFFIGAYDNDESQDNPAFKNFLFNMKQDGLIEVIELKPLTLKETKLLIDVLIPTDEVSDRFLRYIYTKSDGNPLFIKEIVCQLKKRYEDSSSIQSLFPLGKEGRELFLPPSLSEIVEYRCDRLSGRSKHVMKVGSVIGDVIDLDILTAVAGLEESQLLDEIDTLLEKNLLREGIDERLRFVHPLFREVIYSSLSKLKKRKLHEKTARAIETNRDHDIYKYYLDIALHYEKADMPFFALSNYEKAGNDAKKIRDYRFALDCYDRALKLKGNEEDLLEGKERVETLKNDLEELLDQDELPTIYIKS